MDNQTSPVKKVTFAEDKEIKVYLVLIIFLG